MNNIVKNTQKFAVEMAFQGQKVVSMNKRSLAGQRDVL